MNKKNAWSSALVVIAVGTAALSYPLQAQSAESDEVLASAESGSGLLHDRFIVSLGTFLLETKTKVSVNGTAGAAATEVDLKRDLGFKDSDRFRVDGAWRFKNRHKLRMMYFNTSQERTKALARDITVGDTVYPASASVTVKNETTVAELAYEYVFVMRPTYEVAGSAGIHSLKFKFQVSGTGTVNGVTGQFSTETADTTAPLPVFGLRGLWEFSPQWYLEGMGQFFAIKYGDYDGHISDVRVGVTRMFGEHWGVGAGYNSFTTRLGVTKPSFDGELKWRYGGAMIFVTAAF